MRFGVDPGELSREGIPDDRVRALLAFEAERAYEYYAQASPLAPLVNRVGRPVLQTIVGIYRSLLDEIVRAIITFSMAGSRFGRGVSWQLRCGRCRVESMMFAPRNC